MKHVWIAGAAIAVLLAACGGDNGKATPTPEPDRVVGIEIRCDTWSSDSLHRELWGALCTESYTVEASNLSDSSVAGLGSGGGTAFNRRKVLTIRGAAVSYTVNVPINTSVALGDVWPPK
jgi:hypothetical protein